MNYVFITGIPASGKSYLAAKVAKEIGAQHFAIDELRKEMRNNPELKPWVDFFWNQDEKEYWRNTTCEEHWKNMKNQAGAFWPTILKKIEEFKKSGENVIFEGVNILPHLAHKNLDFQGIVLLGETFEKILERNKQDSRWGDTEDLQTKEAEVFWNCERPKYKQEAEQYGFKTFIDPGEAEKELLKIFQI